jgi:hypothetical protein
MEMDLRELKIIDHTTEMPHPRPVQGAFIFVLVPVNHVKIATVERCAGA